MGKSRKIVPQVLQSIPLSVRMPVYAVAFLSVTLGLVPWLAHRIDIHAPHVHVEIGAVRLLGSVVFVACLSLYLICSYVLTTRGRGPFVEFDPPVELVVDGPYRFCRNPVVACLLATILGLAVACSSTGILLYFLIMMLLAHHQVSRLEEQHLRKRFGQAYEDYCSRVPRWIPRRPQTNFCPSDPSHPPAG